jgi:hypothetical protein
MNLDHIQLHDEDSRLRQRWQLLGELRYQRPGSGKLRHRLRLRWLNQLQRRNRQNQSGDGDIVRTSNTGVDDDSLAKSADPGE